MGPSVFIVMRPKRPRSLSPVKATDDSPPAYVEDSDDKKPIQKAAACKHPTLLCQCERSMLDLDEDLTWDGKKLCAHCNTLIPMAELTHCAEECSPEECADCRDRYAPYAGAYASESE